MTIREYAKNRSFEIIGKLTRHPEWEEYGIERRQRAYSDEAGNEYYIDKGRGACIITKDGAVI